MEIKILTVGPIEANCYLVSCSKTKEAVIIDPGAEGEKIKNAVSEEGLIVKYIINTHGHHDHIGANKIIKDFYKNAELLIHEEDAQMLTEPKKNLSSFMGQNYQSPAADRLLKDEDTINFGEKNLQVMHTPGHTPGGICLISFKDNICFTGDTLFYGSVGRTDLPGGNFSILKASLKKLVGLYDKIKIYPGHGPSSTIGEEKLINPYLSF